MQLNKHLLPPMDENETSEKGGEADGMHDTLIPLSTYYFVPICCRKECRV